jgi:hypothetical protein
MPHRREKLQELLLELQRAHSASTGMTEQVRQELATAIRSGELRPVGTGGTSPRKKKAGKKKR